MNKEIDTIQIQTCLWSLKEIIDNIPMTTRQRDDVDMFIIDIENELKNKEL